MNEALILGGGLAGGATAILLARSGVHAHVIERTTGPHHKVCGEFLSIEAQHDLEFLGIDIARLGAVPITRLRLVRGDHLIETQLPFRAFGISRKILDEAILEAACRAGATVERGIKVNGLSGQQVDTTKATYEARSVFLATGKHDIRDARRSSHEKRHAYLGFKMHWRLKARQFGELGESIELLLFDGGYAGLQRIGPDSANLCLLIKRERFADAGGRWEDLLFTLMREPHLRRRLEDAEALFSRPLAIAGLPYGFLQNHKTTMPSEIFRLGDQAAVTAPLSGDGMAMALRSARVAVDCLRSGSGAAHYHKELERLVSGQVRRAMLLQQVTNFPLIAKAGFGLLRLWSNLLAPLVSMTRLPESGRL